MAVVVALTGTLLSVQAALVLAGKSRPGILFSAFSPALALVVFAVSAVLALAYVVVLVRGNGDARGQ